MKTITLVTGNDRKLKEAIAGCSPFEIIVEQMKLNLHEIQSADPIKISTAKAMAAFEKVKKPVVVTDTFWNIPALNGFPGGYMKEVAQWLSPEDFLDFMKNKTDRRISFTESIAFTDGHGTKIFSKSFWGTITDQPRGTGNSIEKIAQFDEFTLGERREQGGLSHKPEDYIWHDFAKWYSQL